MVTITGMTMGAGTPMIDALLRFSLTHRGIVMALAVAVCIFGVFSAKKLPVDVFPDLNRPVVTIFTEAHGLAPEEVEAQVTFPIESAMNGTMDVHRVRSTSAAGFSIVFVEFDWGMDVLQARQLVSERLQQTASVLPDSVVTQIGPVSSIMGEIMLIGIHGGDSVTSMDLRSLADWRLRPRLLSIRGVSQVTVIGGDQKQYQVLVDPAALRKYGISFHDIQQSIESSNTNTTGGFLESGYREILIRNLGRIQTLEDIRQTAIRTDRPGIASPLRIGDVAQVRHGGPLLKRGDAGVDGHAGVILSVQKQPGADTVSLTREVEKELEAIRKTVAPGIVISSEIFQQRRFIEAATDNVIEALRDGALLVAVVLFLFLLSIRTTVITLVAIPLSLLITFIVFRCVGLGVNTMTLGGLAIAIGELVDDAIVDVENVFRRLRENRQLANPRPSLDVVLDASREVRRSIVNATIIVVLVFVPLFAMSGVEGRMFIPLGLGYIISIVASLLVSLTVTPVLCSWLLPTMKQMSHERESWLVRRLKGAQGRALQWTFSWPRAAAVCAVAIVCIAFSLIPGMGREFLPQFNEGSVTINLLSPPGTSLNESVRIGRAAERVLLGLPEIKLIGRRTGRSELDEHAEGVHYTELEAELGRSHRTKEEIFADIRSRLAEIPGTVANIGQPISHRIDHLLSGIRSQIAVKLSGPDLGMLRQKAEEIEAIAAQIQGIVDLQVEKQVLIPQIHVRLNRERVLSFGANVGEVAEYIETAMSGRAITQVISGQERYDVVMRLTDDARADQDAIRQLPIDVGGGKLVPLELLADIEEAKGPNQIVRENFSRRIAVSANVSGRDLVTTVNELQQAVAEKLELPDGYFVSFDGQFESQSRASRLILILGGLSLIGILAVLFFHFGQWNLSMQVLIAEIPFAFAGAVFGVALTNGVLSIASLVGFITLTGIAARNGILLIDHYLYLMREEGEPFSWEMIVRGTQERLVPVLMTAITAVLALIPILLTPGQPGREILHPVAVVIFSGLVTSTIVNLLLTPILFWSFSRKQFLTLNN